MTQEQQTIAEEFQSAIETEYALCVREFRKINQAIANNPTTESADLHGIDCANREIDSIQKYWQRRLGQLIEFIETKDRKLNQQLAGKYLISERPNEQNAIA
jgi:hypothetical protein